MQRHALKTAVVGCGLIATRKYLPILRRLNQRAAIVGLCDRSEDALQRAGTAFGVRARYRDLSLLMSEQRPDVVIVCTPPRTHLEVVVQALTEGAHVLVEKPMALTTQECDCMVQAAATAGRKLGVMHNQLFHHPMERVRDEIGRGAFGRFLGMRVLLATDRLGMTAVSDHWAHRLPGGAVGETGPHAVYLSLAFLKKVRDVHVRLVKQFPEYPWSIGEDVRFDLIADNGISSVTISYGGHHNASEVDVLCTDALVKLDLQARTLVVRRHSRSTPLGVGWSAAVEAWQMLTGVARSVARHVVQRDLDGHYRGVQRFLAYVGGESVYPATGEQGRAAVAVMERVVSGLETLACTSSGSTPITPARPPA